jgi:hypothetical protein
MTQFVGQPPFEGATGRLRKTRARTGPRLIAPYRGVELSGDPDTAGKWPRWARAGFILGAATAFWLTAGLGLFLLLR